MTRLLVLDDEPEICQLVEQVAKGFGIEVTTASDPSQVSPEDIASTDVLVLDLMMPGIDGIEVMRGLPGVGATPRIVLISGLDNRVLEGARQLASAQGLEVIGTLRKPFRPAQLRDFFVTHFAEYQARPQPQQARPQGPTVDAAELERALERNEILVYFQPQVALSNYAWVGVEALARWQHPEHGLLMPGAFIELAETPEFALRFTEHVIRVAIEQYAMLAKELGYAGTLSVNMPPAALTDVHFPERLFRLLRDSDVSPKEFLLELTENSIPRSDKMLLDITTRLTMRGIRISIDDFGTGTSGLERLHDSPFDELKIDMVFVRKADAEATPASRAIVESAVGLGHQLNMAVVAEGVETDSAMNWLKSVGCDVAQGFKIGRPMPMDQLIEWSRQWQSGMPADSSAALD